MFSDVDQINILKLIWWRYHAGRQSNSKAILRLEALRNTAPPPLHCMCCMRKYGEEWHMHVIYYLSKYTNKPRLLPVHRFLISRGRKKSNIFSLRASILPQRTGSTLAQVMVWCLMAPNYYPNQCWLMINEDQWQSYVEISQDMPLSSIITCCQKIICLKCHSSLLGVCHDIKMPSHKRRNWLDPWQEISLNIKLWYL